MTREQAVPYVSFIVDDALNGRPVGRESIQTKDRLVGWQCGFEPLFVAVRSYLGSTIDDDEATELAMDYLLERNWFPPGAPRQPDYVL